jgi:serine/threonine protein kinase
VSGQERFEVLSRLGAGGMGTVHEAYDRVRAERVAIKTFHGLDPFKLYCLKNEFRSLADVVHPNLVSLYELVNHGHEWMLVMERVDGVTLDRWVRVGQSLDEAFPSGKSTEQVADTVPGPGWTPRPDTLAAGPISRPPLRGLPDEARIRDSFAQLAEGITALHRAGKLHRDLKPGNVLVGNDGHVTILDFGLVIDRDDAREPDSARVAGTFEYLSPERVRGEPASEASDWYALGVMLYEALTGVLPYEGAGPASALLRARGVPPRSPTEIFPGIPADLEALCLALLHPEEGARPAGREVVARLSGRHVVVEGDALPPILLMGREREVEQLERAFARAREGELRVLRVVGPSGVGKTALLDAFTRGITQRGDGVVFKSRCLSAEASSYKGVDGIIDALSLYLAARPYDEVDRLLPQGVDALALMFPVLRRVRPVQDAMRPSRVEEPLRLRRKRAVEALSELLEALSRERPLVVCIDDLQWGDDDGGMLWLELIAEGRLSRMLFVSIARGAEADLSPAWRAIDQKTRVEVLSLGPLSAASSQALAGMLLRDAAGPALAARVAQLAGGQPIMLMQLVEYLRETERRGVSDGDVQLSGLVMQRLSRLPAPQRELVEVLSLLARPVAIDALRTVCGSDVNTLVRPLGLSKWVRAQGAGPDLRLEMFHDKLREHVAQDIDGGRQKELHARIARGLSGRDDADPEQLSYHFACAGAHERALHEAERAGNASLSAFAFERASRMFERALSLLPEDRNQERDDLHRRLLLGLAASLEGLGRGQGAAERWAEAAHLTADPADALDLRRRAAEQWLVSGHIERGVALLDEVARAASMTVPKTKGRAVAELVLYRTLCAPKLRSLGKEAPRSIDRQARLRADASFALGRALSLLDTAFAAALQARALWHALESGDRERIAQGVAWEASMRGGLHGPENSGYLALIALAEQAAAELGSTQALAFCGLSRGVTLVLSGQYRAGRDHLERADQLFAREPSSITWELTMTRVFRAAAMSWGGDYGLLCLEMERWLDDAVDRGDGYADTVLRMLTANGMRHALRDDPNGLLADIEARLECWPSHPMAAQVPRRYGDWLRALACLMRGDGEGALVAFARVRASMSMLDYTPPALRVELDYLEGLVLLSQPGELRLGEVKKLERRMFRQQRRFGPALSGLLAAARALRTDDKPAVALSKAEAACDLADMRGFAAVTRWAHGTVDGGAAGEHMAAEAASWLAQEGAVAPERFARLWLMPWTLAQSRPG